MNQHYGGTIIRRKDAVTLAKKVMAGEIRAVSRADHTAGKPRPGRDDCSGSSFADVSSRAKVIGITGYPGTGKSTLIDQLISAYRRLGKRVGVLAVDISSP